MICLIGNCTKKTYKLHPYCFKHKDTRVDLDPVVTKKWVHVDGETRVVPIDSPGENSSTRS